MGRVLNLISSPPTKTTSLISQPTNSFSFHRIVLLRYHLRSNGRFSCLFSDNRKQEQARKALESALGENKDKFEKWNKEIKKREELSGGGNTGGGGWFGWGGRFGWSGGDNFWQEAQQTLLTLLAILVLYLIVAKGDLLLAIIINPVLLGLRSTRNAFTYVTSLLTGKSFATGDAKLTGVSTEPVYGSAKDSVVKKWGN